MRINCAKFKILSDLLEILVTIHLKVLNTNLSLLFKVKNLYLRSKFRQFGAKIKILPDLLENVYASQFEGASNKSDWFKLQPKFTFVMKQFLAN